MDISAQERFKLKSKAGDGFLVKVWGKPKMGKNPFFMTTIKAKCKVCGTTCMHATIDGKHYECPECKQIWEI